MFLNDFSYKIPVFDLVCLFVFATCAEHVQWVRSQTSLALVFKTKDDFELVAEVVALWNAVGVNTPLIETISIAFWVDETCVEWESANHFSVKSIDKSEFNISCQ